MDFRFFPYTLELKHTFKIATHSRTTTPAMLVEVEQDGLIGYGEAAMPPYLGESQETASIFLRKVALPACVDVADIDEILDTVDAISPGNTAAKAAIDIALHDWKGKKYGEPVYRLLGLDPATTPATSFTLGMGSADSLRHKIIEAEACPILKLKLGSDPTESRRALETVRELTNKPITVDANQSWGDRDAALRMIEWLAEHHVLFVEQPFAVNRIADSTWLHQQSPLPIIADESVQRLSDVRSAQGVFAGINIKLMKCTGLREAYRMILLARSLGLYVMLGCMTETSCAISAAAQIASLANWNDLDGALLIQNDPFEGAMLIDGKMLPLDRPGIGVQRRLK